MAACGSLQQIFENPLPENPPLIDSLSSWNQIKPLKSIDHSFTENFGEIHFKESSSPSKSPSLLPPSSSKEVNPASKTEKQDQRKKNGSLLESSFSNKVANGYGGRHRSSDSFSSMNSESLQLCTEGLGFESLDDVEDLKNEGSFCTDNWANTMEKVCGRNHSTTGNYLCPAQYKTAKGYGRTYPPPISCIGRSGKPWVCFKSYRQDGRFVLQEIRILTQEFLHACREDGRLRLCFVQPDDYFLHQEEEEEEEEVVEAEVEEEEMVVGEEGVGLGVEEGEEKDVKGEEVSISEEYDKGKDDS
ncbi:hypothetical protein Ancab_011272 [Ancistrocladus abbreviatus]